jgi:uncharacterized protein YndB with AHSA1/START domain
VTEDVEVTVRIDAAPVDVFTFLTDQARYVQWMGAEAKLEPQPGGVYQVRMSDGMAAAGTFLQVEPPHLVMFTWGFADAEAAGHTLHQQAGRPADNPMPPGSTRVTVTLHEDGDGTRLTLRHDDLPGAELREGHRVAWQIYLGRLAVRAAGGDPGTDPHSS